MKKKGLHEPNFIGNEKKYLLACINDNWVSTSGKFLNSFEKKICKITKSKFAVPVLNATIGLHLSLILANVKKNDEVIVPTITFVATINSIIYTQASPIFMDVDKNLNIDEMKTIEFILKRTRFINNETVNIKTKKKIKALVIVHTFGNAAEFEKLYSLCKKRNIKIIEDAAESLGTIYKSGKFKKRHTGTIGDYGVISFNGNKIITSGNGGVVLTHKKNIYRKANYLITHSKDDKTRFIHNEVGFNYKLSNLSAALGLAQIEKLEFFLKQKNKVRNFYKQQLKYEKNIKLLETPSYSRNNNWLNLVKVKSKKNIFSLIKKMKKNNIDIRPVWKPNHLQIPFKKYEQFKVISFEKNLKNVLCLPSSSSLKKNEVIRITNLLKKFLND